MKKLLVLSLALAMVVAFTLPASAFESVFGGYWRVRAISQEKFSGQNNGDGDLNRVDSRTRLYYTAVLNDNLKFINKFEFDNQWGNTAQGGYGDYGADGIGIEIKQTYIDANMGPVRAKIGTFDVTYARGFIYADEQSGVTLSFKIGDFLIPFSWTKGFEGNTGTLGANSKDVDVFGLYPVFQFGEAFNLNPFVIYGYSKDDAAPMTGTTGLSTYGQNAYTDPYTADGAGVYWLGANADFNIGPVALWATGVYVGGEIKNSAAGGDDIDVKGYLGAVGASMALGPVELHGQGFYASGDDDEDDSDFEAFFGIGGGGVGWAYYWSEIMGLGVFDQQASAGQPNADVSNLWALNLGASFKPMEKLKLTGDIWYASLVERNQTGEKKLGTELDLKADYQLAEGLNLTLVGAYLFADDATSNTADDNDKDPYELGAQLSISF
jgi:hypothetical protein